MKKYIFTPLGYMELVQKDNYMEKVIFLNEKPDYHDSEKHDPLLNECEKQIHEYFDRKRTDFDLPICFEKEGFTGSVIKAVNNIPYNKTLTYGEIARAIRLPKASRAVGNAVGTNPLLLLIPCHRVTRTTGISGYSGGIWRKQFLLALEQGIVDELGLHSHHVSLKNHSPLWADLFEIEKRALLTLPYFIPDQIQHIGSTSIHYIKAKPIIDILVGIQPERESTIIQDLETIGYRFKERFDPPEWLFFAKGCEHHITHHLHICHYQSDFFKSHVLFRELLNKDMRLAKQYEKIKAELSAQFSNNRKEYTLGKDKFISSVLGLAHV